jgi:hypothetical protein
VDGSCKKTSAGWRQKWLPNSCTTMNEGNTKAFQMVTWWALNVRNVRNPAFSSYL